MRPSTARDTYFNDYFSSGKLPAGAAPASINGGVLSIPGGGTAYFQVDLKSGKYTVVSSLTNVNNDPNQTHADFTVS